MWMRIVTLIVKDGDVRRVVGDDVRQRVDLTILRIMRRQGTVSMQGRTMLLKHNDIRYVITSPVLKLLERQEA
jgi:hypothetical protein